MILYVLYSYNKNLKKDVPGKIKQARKTLLKAITVVESGQD